MSKKRYVITASAFDKKGRVICSRQNVYSKSHPFQKHCAVLAGEPYKEALHAEIACLIASKRKDVDKIVVLRYDALGRLKLAKPCKVCEVALRIYAVKTVVYSTEDGLKSYNL